MAALVFVTGAFLFAALALPDLLAGSPLSLHFDLPLGLSFGFYADALAVFMAMAASFVAIVPVALLFFYAQRSFINSVMSSSLKQ